MRRNILFLGVTALAPIIAAATPPPPVAATRPTAPNQPVDWASTALEPYSKSYPLLQAIGAYHDGGPAAAKPFLLDSADSGNRIAMRILGLMYARGEGVAADGREAIKWFKAAAERGDGESMYILGIAYANGTWVDQDRETAARWLRRAAARHVPNASRKLRSLQLQGG